MTAFEHHSFTSLPTSWSQESVKRARNGDDSIAVMDIYTTVADLMIKVRRPLKKTFIVIFQYTLLPLRSSLPQEAIEAFF